MHYHVGDIAMHEDLTETYNGMVYIQHLLNVINDGSYNFLNPSANSGAMNDYLMPEDHNTATSDEDQAQASVTIPVMKLSGGDLDFSVGVSTAYEAVDAPSANTDLYSATGRYFAINPFATQGSRDVNSVYFEVNAPILDNLTVNGAETVTGFLNLSTSAGNLAGIPTTAGILFNNAVSKFASKLGG